MTHYRLQKEYRNILIPIGILLFASGIVSFGNILGNLVRVIFAIGTVYLVYKYLVMPHTVTISDENSVCVKGFLRKRKIPGNHIQRIRDFDFFIRVVHNDGAFIIVCLFERFSNLKSHLRNLDHSIQFMAYEKEGREKDLLFKEIIKIIIHLIIWI